MSFNVDTIPINLDSCNSTGTSQFSITNNTGFSIDYQLFERTISNFHFAYAANYNDNSVSVINTRDNSVIGTVNVGSGPIRCRISPDYQLVYVANRHSDNISIISTATNTVVNAISVGNGPNDVVFTPEGDFVYVSNQYDNTVSVIDCNGDSVLTTISHESFDDPVGMDVTPDGKYIYVANRNTGISIIDVAGDSVISSISGFTQAHSVQVSPNGEKVYVGESTNSGYVKIIDVETNTKVDSIGPYNYPMAFDITADGQYMYIALHRGYYLYKINLETNVQEYSLYYSNMWWVWDLAISADEKYAYLGRASASYNPNFLIFDLESGSFVTETAIQRGVWGISTLKYAEPWYSLSSTDGSLSSGANEIINVDASNTGLIAGTHYSTLLVKSTGSATVMDTVIVELTSAGTPSISMESASLDFGNVFLGGSKTLGLKVYNNGCDTLEISNITTSYFDFSVESTSLKVNPYDSNTVNITLTPSSTGGIAGTLTIYNNDENQVVSLSGNGLNPPILSVDKDSIVETFSACSITDTFTFSIQNLGISDLIYNLVSRAIEDSSIIQYLTSGATTDHTFEDIYSDSIFLEITLNGDFTSTSEYASLYIDGEFIEQIEDDNLDNIDMTYSYKFGGSQLSNWLVDNQITVTLVNSYAVNSGYTYDLHKVRLSASDWVNVNNLPDTLSTNETAVIDVIFNASKLASLTHQSVVYIKTNDPVRSLDSVKCKLTVIGDPELDLSANTIQFDTISQYSSTVDSVIIYNKGCDTLKITSITNNENDITFSDSALIIDPYSSSTLLATFSPLSAQEYTDTIFLVSNDVDTLILLSAFTYKPPVIDLSADSFHVILASCDDSSSESLTISNLGDTTLTFNITQLGYYLDKDLIKVAVYNNSGIADVLNKVPDIEATAISTYDSATLAEYDVLMNIRTTNLSQDVVLNFISNGGAWIGEYTSNNYPVSSWNVIEGTISGSGGCCSNGINILDDDHYLATNIDWENLPVGMNPTQYMVDIRGISDPSANIIVTSDHTSFPDNPLLVEKEYGNGKIILFNWDYQDDPDYNSYVEDMIQEVVRYSVAKRGARWLAIDTVTESVVKSNSTDRVIKFNASGMPAGDYENQFVIYSNDPISENDTVTCTVSISGVPEIDLSKTSIAFDTVFQYGTVIDTFVVYNTGCDTLVLSNVSIANSDYAVNVDSVKIEPFDSAYVIVTFNPQTVGGYTDTLTILNNDSDTIISLSGYAESPPIISFNTDTLELTIENCSDSSSTILTISNSGTNDLEYSIELGQNLIFSDISVLLVAAENDVNYINDVKTKLMNTGKFKKVDTYNAYSNTPTLAYLSNYDAILVWRNNGFNNATTIGDNLADYIDAGGGVVIAHWATSTYSIYGRFNTDNYWVIVPADNTSSSNSYLDMGTIHKPGHYLLKDVNSFNGGSYSYRASTTQVQEGAEKIADWEDGTVLIAARVMDSAKRVDLNFWPPSSDVRWTNWNPATADGDLIMANALEWVSGKEIDWIRTDISSDTVVNGSSSDVTLTFRSAGLVEGIYNQQLIVNSNDPVSTPDTIECLLYFNGPPTLELSDTSVVFDTLELNDSYSNTLKIYNSGCDTLEIDSLKGVHLPFNYSVDTSKIVPGDSITVTISISTDTFPTLYEDTLVIYTNDKDTAVTISALVSSGLITISEARDYGVGAFVMVEGIATTYNELDSNIRYLQDSTAGIAVNDIDKTWIDTVERGDSIRVTGEIAEYNGLLEIKNMLEVNVLSEANPIPEVQLISVDQMNESYEGQLVQIVNNKFVESGTFGAGAYHFVSEGDTGEVYVKGGYSVDGEEIPRNFVNLTGILSQYHATSPDSGYRLLIRDINDIEEILEGIVAFYPFNGNAEDSSGYENNGTVTGAVPVSDRFGNDSSAYYFDGTDDNIIVANDNSLDLTTAYTLTAWIKPISTSGKYLICKDDAVYPAHVYSLDIYPGQVRSVYRDIAASTHQTTGSTTITSDKWQFIAGTWDGSILTVYYNGLLENISSQGSTISTNAMDLEIGYSSSGSNYYNGIIDDVRIYKRALDEGEIADVYGNYFPPTNLSGVAGDGSVTLKWNSDRISIFKQYNIYRDGILVASSAVSSVNDTVFVDTDVTNFIAYDYYITSVDSFGNESQPSDTITVKPIEAGLVAYFPFNGNATDETFIGNDGTVYGAVLTTDRFGNDSSAYYFDGIDDYINIGNGIGNSNQLTLSAWVYFVSGNTAANSYSIVSKEGADISGKTFRLYKDKQLYGNEFSGIYYQDSTGVVTYSETVADSGKWYHVVSVYDNGNSKLYINGDLEDQLDSSMSLQFSSSDVLIGNDSSDFDYFNGIVDDVKIFHSAEDSNKIYELYANFHPPVDFSAEKLTNNITLRWSSERIEELAWYRIYRDSILIDSVEITGAEDTVYVDTDISNYQPYAYFITSVDTLGNESQPTVEVEITYSDILIAEYKFSDNTDDESGNGNHGFNYDVSFTSDRFGNENSTAYFDSAVDKIILPDQMVDISKSFSVSVWFKTEEYPVGSQKLILHQHDNDKGVLGRIVIGLYDDGERLRIRNIGNGSRLSSAKTDIVLNTWHHVIIVHNKDLDSNNFVYYIDGKSDTIMDAEILEGSKDSLVVGHYKTEGYDYLTFKGSIDDMSLYNYPLSQYEAKNLYANYHGPDTLITEAAFELITLRWSSEDIEETGWYRIYRDSVLIDSVEVLTASDTVYNDSSVVNYVNYTYFVTSVDTLGYESQPSNIDTIQAFEALIVPVVSNDTSYCNGDSLAEIVAVPQSGGDIIWYSDSLGQNEIGMDSTFTPYNQLGTTIYFVREFLGSDASPMDSVSVTIFDNPYIQALADTAVCFGDNAVLDLGFNSTYTYFWTTSETESLIKVSNEGQYSVTVTDTNSCISRDTMNLTVYSLPVVTITGDTSICTGDSTIFAADSGFNSYSWNTGDTVREITINTGMDYIVTVVDSNLCSNTDTMSLSLISLPTINPITDTTICDGSSISIDAGYDVFYTYNWNVGGSTSSIDISLEGIYKVTVTDTNNCISADSMYLSLYNLPEISITGDSGVCSGDSSLLNVTQGFNEYLWNTGDSTDSLWVKSTGIYKVTVTDANLCSSTDSVEFTEHPLPEITITGDTTVCIGDSTTLDAGSGYVSYSWNTGESTQSVTKDTEGDYIVTVTDANSCVNSAGVTISFSSPPVMTALKDTGICEGDISTLDVGYNDSYSYSWNTGESTNAIDVSIEGTYVVTVSDTAGCAKSDSMFLTVFAIPVIDITGDTTVCIEDSSMLAVTTGFETYTWNTADTSEMIWVKEGGTYEITVTDSNTCTNSISVNVSILNLPGTTLMGDTAICIGDSVILDAGAGDSFFYSWNTGESTQTIDAYNEAFYKVTVTDSNNCTSVDSMYLTVNSLPIITMTGEDTICAGDSSVLDAGADFTSYVWNTVETSQTIIVKDEGSYKVTVTDTNGCVNTDSVLFVVHELPVINEVSDTALCDVSSVFIDVGFNASYTYHWNTGASTPYINITSEGLYRIDVVNTENCSISDSFNVTFFDLPVVSISGNDNYCSGDSTLLDAGDGFTEYIWQNSKTTQTIYASVPDKYKVTITDINGCSNSDSMNVIENALPEIVISNDTSLCPGDSLEIVVSSFDDIISYLWSNGDTTSSIHVVDSGKYMVSITNTNNCVSTDSMVFMNYDLPQIELGEDLLLCGGDSIDVDAGEGFLSYAWNTGESTRIINADTSGLYKVIVSDEHCQNSDSLFIGLYPVPVSGLPDFIEECPGNRVDLDPGAGFVSYKWYDNRTSQTIGVFEDGDYWVTLTDANGCNITDTAEVKYKQVYQGSEICMLTVNTNGNIMVIWEKTYNVGIAKYLIYRETDKAGDYEQVDSKLFTQQSFWTDLDATVKPKIQSYKYKLLVEDSCGNRSDIETSPYHKTLHLASNVGTSGENNLIWEPYEGLDFQTYQIYRGTSEANLQPLSTIPSTRTQFTDEDPPTAAAVYYQLSIELLAPCILNKKKALAADEFDPYKTFSNILEIRATSTSSLYSDNQLKIYPVPARDYVYIEFPNANFEEFKLMLYSVSGELIKEVDKIYTGRVKLDNENLAKGFYIVELVSNNNIYKGRLIIE
ncbi:LamG-like jellyroll fold domain-containing protein [Bacteroidota bacterium]